AADSRIQCYDCNSNEEPRCLDPFNHSVENRPVLRECQGCCVKIVKKHGKHDTEVRRTCTERLQINMFLVDHVCMYESGGGGHMCFCESDACNAAPRGPSASRPAVRIALLLTTTALLVLLAPPSRRINRVCDIHSGTCTHRPRRRGTCGLPQAGRL
ncbi:unnamed protein product, partial [Ixodes hexagonus]